MYAFKLCLFSINTSVLFCNENNILFLFFRNQQVGNDGNVMTNMLLELLIRSENKNKELLQENKKLVKKNEQLNMEVKELRTSATQEVINKNIERDIKKKAEDITINVLRKIFTPGQIKSLMSPHNVRFQYIRPY